MGALRPKRGSLATATSKNILLKEGEIFIETPDGGFGSAKGKIKIGDGVTRYADLGYFLESGSGINTRVDKSTGTVTTSGWSSTVDPDGFYTQIVSIPNKDITSGTILINTVASDSSSDEQVAGYMLIKKIVPTTDGFICYATTKPTLNVSIDFFYTVLYSDTSLDITPASIGAIAEPAVSGTNGQVLATDGQGGTSWVNVQSSGALSPCGTVTFANLPSISTANVGDMYNVSDAFTSTADFKEGSGHSVPAGANVYKTSDGKWDILAGVIVTGVKGNKETNYRLGNVNLTPANIGAASISEQYAECSTARNVTAKTVTLAGFKLETGARISVRFTDTGTSNPERGHITLNVNGTGAKKIVDGHTNMTILGYTSGGLFYNNIVNDFIYDGTYWVYMNRDNNTTYSSKAAASGGTATSLCTTGEKYTWNNKQNTLTFDNVPTKNSNNPVKSGGVFSALGVPKIDTTTGVMYLEGGAAFSGNIDSTPTANSNNAVASGGTKTYVDNAVNTAMDNCKMAVFTKTLTLVAIDRAWGSVYESIGQSIDISSLGLSSIPKAVFLGVTSTTGAIMYELSNVTSSKIDFYLVRGNSVTVSSVKVNALVLY